jgi:hypothetical protein
MYFKKLLYFSLLISSLAIKAEGQTYYQVTDTGGTQSVGGINVTVTHIGGPLSTLALCGILPPYRIDPAFSPNVSSIKYSFSSPVHTIRAHILSIDTDDTIEVKFNGSLYYVTSANLSSFTPTSACQAVSNSVTTYNGYMIGTVQSSPLPSVQFDAQPGYGIDTVEIIDTPTSASGIIYDFYFANVCSGTVTATAIRDTLCTGDTLHLLADTSAVSSSATYSWAGPNGFTSTLQNPLINNVSNSDSGTYTVTVTDTSGCVYTSSIAIVIYNGSATMPVITITNSPVLHIQGDTITFTGHILNGASGFSYQWTKNGVNIPNATDSTYTTDSLSPGDTICLVVYSPGHCSVPDSSVTCTELTTGVNSIQTLPGSLNIYPNPNQGLFTVWGTFINCEEATLEILNPIGQTIYKDEATIANNLLNRQINMNIEPAGVYLFLIKTEKGTILKRFFLDP